MMDRHVYDRIKSYCDSRGLFTAGDGVVVGVSGGADSVFLLEFLLELQGEMGLELCVVHVNHGIRGVSAAEDERMVEELAQRRGLLYRCFHAAIPQMAKEEQKSEEEMGRIFRYRCFEQVRQEMGYTRIAVAHHCNDQAETVLFQLLRGSALRGICGMSPKNGFLVRPLLAVERWEIEEQLRQMGMSYQEDDTNGELTYTRNRIRNQVIPFLRENIQPETVSHIARTADYMQELRDFVERQAQGVVERLVKCEKNGVSVPVGEFSAVEPVLQRECLLQMLEMTCGRRKDLANSHVEQLCRLLRGGTGKRISLPYGMQAGRDYDCFWIRRIVETVEEGERELCLPEGEMFLTGEKTLHMAWCVSSERPMLEQLKKNGCNKWFDYGKIYNTLVFRHPQPGDFLWLQRDGGRKKLSRVLIDAKIAREQRAKFWVLAEGSHILWVPQLGRGSAYYYVDEDTREFLIVRRCE